MGIKGLTRFLTDHAPSSVKVQELSSLLGRTVAIDASMSLYQFMVAIRDAETFGNLTNEAGETTSHISGMLSRVVRLLEKGVRPAYVFDGKPPVLKGGELAKRQHRRSVAEASLKDAQEAGDVEGVKKMVGRTVRVTKQHNDDVKELLRLLGVPVIQAPGEAEAQCARLCSSGQVYATATEDADALTFGSSILIRHLSFTDRSGSAGSKTVGKNGVIPGKQILVINLEAALAELGLSYEQFVDFCILCGCDYCDTIKGIGPSTAFKLIKDHSTLENVMTALEGSKHVVPEIFPYAEARQFFIKPEIAGPEEVELKWTPPDFEELRSFLVDKHSFDGTRIDNYFKRLRSSQGTSSQTRLESFFGGGVTKLSSTAEAAAIKAKSKSKAKAKSSTSFKVGGGPVKRRASAVAPPLASGSLLAAAAVGESCKRQRLSESAHSKEESAHSKEESAHSNEGSKEESECGGEEKFGGDQTE